MNRRDLFKAFGAAAALPGFCYGGLEDSARKRSEWKIRLSTSSIHFMQLPIEEACARIAKLGFEAVDIWSAHEGCPHLDDVANRLGAKGLKELLAKHKLKLFAFSVYRGGFARYAKLLGAAGGGVAVRGSAAPCKPNELTGRMRAFIDGLKPLVELAEENNSYLAIENHGNALLNSIDSLKAFVDANKSPRLGIALAPYHVQGRKESVAEAIRVCGRQLLFFYAWQRQPGVKQLPGIGSADMRPWVEVLARIRYRGFVNPFMHGHPKADVMAANLAKSRDYLLDCYKNIHGQQLK